MGATPVLTATARGPGTRIVFDTNIVISALIFGGRLAWLRRSWASGETVPILCRETVTELLRVLAYPKFSLSPREQDLLLADYLPFGEAVMVPDRAEALAVPCRDPNDTIFIQLAIAAAAAFLVSGDADLASLRSSSPVAVISAEELRRFLHKSI